MGVPTTGIPPIGALSKCWITPTIPFARDTAQCFEFMGEGMSARGVNAQNDAIRGTRSIPRERNRRVAVVCSGQITLTPSKTELATLLPFILGASQTGSGTSGTPFIYAISERLTPFQMLIQKVDTGVTSHTKAVYLYENCFVSRATFSAAQGGLLTVTLDIEASTEKYYAHNGLSTGFDGVTDVVQNSGSPVTVVPTSVPDTNTRWIFADTQGASGNFKIGGADREAFDWSLTIDNMLDTTRQMNSLYRRTMPALGRSVQMAATIPFTTAEDELYDLAVNSASPDVNDNNVRFYAELGTNDDVLDVVIGTWNTEPVTPVVSDKGEIVLPLSGPLERKNTSTAKDEIGFRMWTT